MKQENQKPKGHLAIYNNLEPKSFDIIQGENKITVVVTPKKLKDVIRSTRPEYLNLMAEIIAVVHTLKDRGNVYLSLDDEKEVKKEAERQYHEYISKLIREDDELGREIRERKNEKREESIPLFSETTREEQKEKEEGDESENKTDQFRITFR